MKVFDIDSLVGDYDNFRQYWKENTEEALHRDDVEHKHQHLHLKIQKLESRSDTLQVKYFSDRNNASFIGSEEWFFLNDGHQFSLVIGELSFQLDTTDDGIVSKDGSFDFTTDRILLSLAHRDNMAEDGHFEFLLCRYFSGFIEYALDDAHERYHRLGDLVLHDQGGMAELIYNNESYTVELTQLVFAHKIFLMKVAIYDMPISEVGINSKAISYVWSDPSSKRLGINIRKIISGWTFIEEGFLSSNTLELEEG